MQCFFLNAFLKLNIFHYIKFIHNDKQIRLLKQMIIGTL